jgi:hypothetical protein
MSKGNINSYKHQQKQFEKQNGNMYVSQRAERRESDKRHSYNRQNFSDKIWYDSLTFDEKEKVIYYSIFYNQPGWWFGDSDLKMQGEETKDDYCKRLVPGCPHKQREMKINKIVSEPKF